MKFLVFGSINSDVLFSVDHIVTAGETISSKDVKLNAGGKGANQAAALGKSGLEVFFAGKCNENGRWILELLESFNVDTSLSILSNQVQTGQAIIQIDSKGQNSIILSPGGNDSFEEQEAENILSPFGEGDAIILQNEINITAQLIDMAKERKMTVFLNPSPFDSRAKNFDYNKVDYIFINEIEACGLAGCQMNDDIDFGFCKNIGDCILTKYPEIKIISNEKVFSMLPQFIDEDILKVLNTNNLEQYLEDKKIVVKEGDTINLGKHTLQFIMAPMVHWPEVMLTYEQSEKILFSADAFGKFGTLDTDEPWVDESRRYFINIVGKYGMQVQNLLKKASSLDIQMICSLHGPILKDNLDYYIGLYNIWSKYEAEEDGILVVCGSLHGNTYQAAKKFAEDLKEKGNNVKFVDIARESIPDVVSEAFKYSKMCIACATYNMNIFPAMNSFLHLLREKNFQNRKIGIIENGSWAPNAAKVIKDMLSMMKNIDILEPVVTIKTKLNKESEEEMKKLEKAISK